jgi:hypothetical protein
MKASLRNPRTGEVVDVKVGFDLVLFLTSWFLGVPLFLRKLNVWGAFMFALTIVYDLAPRTLKDAPDELSSVIGGLVLYGAFSLFFGIKGSELTAKNYLDLGWQFVNPEAEETKAAKLTWGIKI